MMMLRAVAPPPQSLFSAFGIMIMCTEEGERFRDYIFYIQYVYFDNAQVKTVFWKYFQC